MNAFSISQRTARVALSLLGIVMPLFAHPAPTLQCIMSAPISVATNAPVPVTVRIHNAGEANVWVLNWQTPFEGLLGDAYRIDHEQRRVAYQGPKIKRGEPESEEYILIPTKTTVEATVELQLAYDFTQTGRYRIHYLGQLHDVYADATTSSGQQSPPSLRTRAQFTAEQLRCNSVDLLIEDQ